MGPGKLGPGKLAGTSGKLDAELGTLSMSGEISTGKIPATLGPGRDSGKLGPGTSGSVNLFLKRISVIILKWYYYLSSCRFI